MTLFSPTRAFKLLVWCMLIFDDAISIHHSTGLNRGEFSYLFISPFHSSTSVGLTLAFSQVKIQSFYAHQIQFTRLNFLRDENYLFFEISVFQNGHLENRVVGEMKKKKEKKTSRRCLAVLEKKQPSTLSEVFSSDSNKSHGL